MEGRWPPLSCTLAIPYPSTQCSVFPPYFCGDKTPRDVMALADSNFGKFRPRWAVWAKTIGTFEKRRRATVDLLGLLTRGFGRAPAAAPLGIPPVFLCSVDVSSVRVSQCIPGTVCCVPNRASPPRSNIYISLDGGCMRGETVSYMICISQCNRE